MPSFTRKQLRPILKELLEMHEAGYDDDTLVAILQKGLDKLPPSLSEKKALGLLYRYYNENSGGVRPNMIIPLQKDAKRHFAFRKAFGIGHEELMSYA